jgi:hypothetical protein
MRAFITARDAAFSSFVAEEALLSLKALAAARDTLVTIESHGETLVSVDHLSLVVDRLPNLVELQVSGNTSIVPELFLDTSLPICKLKVWGFRPAHPSQHMHGGMRSVADPSCTCLPYICTICTCSTRALCSWILYHIAWLPTPTAKPRSRSVFKSMIENTSSRSHLG